MRKALAGGARIVQYRNKAVDARLRRAQGAVLLALCREAGGSADRQRRPRSGARDRGGRRAPRPRRRRPRRRARRSSPRARSSALPAMPVSSWPLPRATPARTTSRSAVPSPRRPSRAHRRRRSALYREAKRRLDCPIVAIGGITSENAGALIDAGVHAIAVISALFDAPDIERRARDFSNLFPGREPEGRGRIAAS